MKDEGWHAKGQRKDDGFVLKLKGFFAARMERNKKNSSGGKGENTRNEADQWGGQKEGKNTVIIRLDIQFICLYQNNLV